jgi:hypothetical protein
MVCSYAFRLLLKTRNSIRYYMLAIPAVPDQLAKEAKNIHAVTGRN